MNFGTCELRTCRYNDNGVCIDELNRKRCVDLCSAVLGDRVMDFFEKERTAEDDLK